MTNPAPSVFTTGAFIALEGVMVALWLAAIPRTGIDAGRGLLGRGRLTSIGFGLLIWTGVPHLLAARGVLDRWTMPPPSMLVILVVTIATVGLAFSRSGGFWARLPLEWLVGFQVFRVAVELLLHRLYVEGVIPVQMTYSGRNFDILTGLSAPIVAWVIARRPSARGLVLAWNVAGMLLLANIVTIAVQSTPTALRTYMNEPANVLPGIQPFVALPTLFVQLALFGHLVTFRALMRRDREPAATA